MRPRRAAPGGGTRKYVRVPFGEEVGELPSFKDFVCHRGVYYVAGKNGVTVFARPQDDGKVTGQPLPLGIPTVGDEEFIKIAASENNIYLVEANRRTVWNVPRAVPI